MGNSGNNDRLYFLGSSKITAGGDCSHEIKRHLLPGRKAITNQDSILKSRDITLPTKVRLVKAMVFPVVMYGCESWTIKKAERQRIDAFELWCQRRLLRVPYKETARRSNQEVPGSEFLGTRSKVAEDDGLQRYSNHTPFQPGPSTSQAVQYSDTVRYKTTLLSTSVDEE